MADAILYGVDGSPYVRSARPGLEEKGVAYDYVNMAILYMKQQPHGRWRRCRRCGRPRAAGD